MLNKKEMTALNTFASTNVEQSSYKYNIYSIHKMTININAFILKGGGINGKT